MDYKVFFFLKQGLSREYIFNDMRYFHKFENLIFFMSNLSKSSNYRSTSLEEKIFS